MAIFFGQQKKYLIMFLINNCMFIQLLIIFLYMIHNIVIKVCYPIVGIGVL